MLGGLEERFMKEVYGRLEGLRRRVCMSEVKRRFREVLWCLEGRRHVGRAVQEGA